MNVSEIAERLAAQASEVAAYLLPNGRKHGPEWQVGSVAGEAGKSLSVRLTGAKRGVWKDFATGEGGDLIDLFMATRGVSVAEAIREAKQYLGITDDMPARPERVYARPSVQAKRPGANVRAWLRARGLTDETIKAFKVGADAADSTVLLPYLRDGETVNVKHRSINDKRKMWQAKDAEPCLFGWHLVDPKARVVAITEGEFDAMALVQLGIAALSVNQGAGNHQWIESDWERLERFSTIYLCFDADDAGRKGAREVANRLGLDRCRVVTFGASKDANDFLLTQPTEQQVGECFAKAGTFDPDELMGAGSFVDELIAEFYPPETGYVAPALRLGRDHEWFRFRPSEVTTWTGHNGHGKSQTLGQVQLGLMEQGEKFCVFSGEMPPAKLLGRLARQACGMSSPSISYLKACAAWLDAGMWIFNVIGQADSVRLLEVFAYAARRYGITHFVIDSLMMLEDVPEDGKGALEAQRRFMNRIATFAKQYRVHVHLVAHPRKADNERDAPGKQDVAGSGKLTNMADNHFSVWAKLRDAGEEPDDTPDGFLELNKQRHGNTQHRKLWLWFDADSLQYRVSPHHRPRHYIPAPGQTEAA